jgi:hypothetical protein
MLIAKKPFILMNGSPKPVFQYQLAEDYFLGISKTGYSKERFSKPALSLKNHSYRLKTVHTYGRFSKPAIYSMIRLKIRCSQTGVLALLNLKVIQWVSLETIP